MRALLLYNPAAGTSRRDRLRLIQQLAAVLQAQGFNCRYEATLGKGSAGAQARAAIKQGTEAVFACGGDGTIHDVLQGVAETQAALGILPLGSANALARELGIASNPLRAAQSLSPSSVASHALSSVSFSGRTRWFLTMAGAGPDGHLMYRMLTVDRSRYGRWRYYEHALRLWLGHTYPKFQVEYTTTEGELRPCLAVSAMALRIGSLGGVFAGLAEGASLRSEHLRLILVHAPARFTLPLWFVCSWLRVTPPRRCVTVVDAVEVTCSAAHRLHLQADGEWLGCAPATIGMSGRRLRVLVPEP